MAAKLTPLGKLAEPVGRFAEEALLRANDTLNDACAAIRDAKPEDAKKHAQEAKAWTESIERLASESGVEVDEMTTERMAEANQMASDILALAHLSGGTVEKG